MVSEDDGLGVVDDGREDVMSSLHRVRSRFNEPIVCLSLSHLVIPSYEAMLDLAHAERV